MQEKVLKFTAVFTIIFSVLAAGLMGWFQLNRENLISRDTLKTEVENETEVNEEVVSLDTASDFMHLNISNTQQNGKLSVEFPTETSLQGSAISFDYVNQYVYLWIPKISDIELQKSSITADNQIVKVDLLTANKKAEDEIQGMEIKIPVSGYYMGEFTTKDNMLNLTFEELKPSKELTVVLDAGHGGKDTGSSYGTVNEKDVTLKVVQRIAEKLEKQDIRVLCTRYTDTDESPESRVAFANAIKADMLISVHLELLEKETKDKKIGLTAYYNGKYFIPEFGSIELSNILEQETIQNIGGKANGLVENNIDNILISHAKVPVTELEIDSTIQEQELKKIQSDSYLDRVADGIYKGIMKAKESVK